MRLRCSSEPRSIALVALVALAALGPACVSVAKAYPEIRTYVLEAPRPGEPAPAFDRTLLVRRLAISPRYSGKAFVRTEDALRFESDYYHQFFVVPQDLVTEALRNWIASSGLFAHVIDSGSRAEPEFVLEGNVAALYGDREDGGVRGVLELQVVLLRETRVPARIEFEQVYRREVTAQDDSALGLVRAWNQALAEVLTALEADLRAHPLAASGTGAAPSPEPAEQF